MAVATNIPGPGFPAPPEPDLVPAEVIARAEAIAPTLVARQAETEQRTFYAPDVHEAFARAGFYRILVPRRYGGYEFGIGTFLRVSMALARGCPSTGWMYCLGAAHALPVATLFGERAQRELFADGDFISPAAVAPAGTAERTGDGSWLISGVWPYCSGAPYATHFIGHTLVADEHGQPSPMLFAAPRSQWRRLDDWGGQLGLRGSGSHSIALDAVRVPDHLTLGTHLSNVTVTDGTPGRALHDSAEYGGAPFSSMFLGLAALAVGMAQGALDEYADLMRTRTTLYPPVMGRSQDPDYQRWYGEAAGLIATAQAATADAVRQWQGICDDGPAAFTRAQDLRIGAICNQVIKLSWRAVESCLFPTAGSSAVREGQRIERVWRDMSTFHSHSGVAVFLTSIATRALAQAQFGDGFAAFDASGSGGRNDLA